MPKAQWTQALRALTQATSFFKLEFHHHTISSIFAKKTTFGTVSKLDPVGEIQLRDDKAVYWVG